LENKETQQTANIAAALSTTFNPIILHPGYAFKSSIGWLHALLKIGGVHCWYIQLQKKTALYDFCKFGDIIMCLLEI